MDDIMVSVKDVSMEFNMSNYKIDNLKEYMIRLFKRELFFKSFYALRDVSFDVPRGEIFGIIGLNGSGKSTLLKIVSGIFKPTMGSVEINGTLSPMIELGTGFDPDLTARENIYLNGSILGHSKKEMDALFDEIVDFAELWEFLDTPIKNYSSGMMARLGFAIATTVDPQILIVDEVLSVGDFKFQEKCEARIKKLMEGDTTVIFVSHDVKQVERLCSRVLWLEKGQMKMIGPTKEITEIYKNS